MMEPLDFERSSVIVEYGPGTGSFTRELFARKRPETKLVLLEQNAEFFREMYEQYHGKYNTLVLRGSAEHADALLLEATGIQTADAIVSGLPFTSLPLEVTLRVFRATRRILGAEGIFVTFQYTRLKEGLFSRNFEIVDRLRELRNLPPAYVYVMKNRPDFLRAAAKSENG